MRHSHSRRPRSPLDGDKLNELALHYVGKYATSRAKLSAYLSRKVRERGWGGQSRPEIDQLVDRFTEAGLIDDANFALAKSRSLSDRGYGKERVRQALRAAGIQEADGTAAHDLADDEAVASALRFARRRHIGPFADATPDLKGRQKAIATMIRAGHSFDLAKAVVDTPPGSECDLDELLSKTS
jgi:regulatory protein